MVTKIEKWGNGQGLHIDNDVLQKLHIAVGDDVNVSVRGDLIVITPVKRVRGRHSLDELVSRIPKDYKAEEIDWGKPVGK